MLHDIFTKRGKNKKKENKIKIIADIHEKNSLVIPTLIELGAEVETKALEIGDYMINNIAIERKTSNDFVSSMLSKRLQEQLNQLQQYDKKLIILEGEFIQKNSNIHPNALKGQILAILTHYNTPIIFTKNAEDTSQYLFLLAKQQIKGVQEASLHSRKPKTTKEQKKYIIESFPDIGPKNAELLLKKFKSIKNIIKANEKELQEVLGKKAENIIKLRG